MLFDKVISFHSDSLNDETQTGFTHELRRYRKSIKGTSVPLRGYVRASERVRPCVHPSIHWWIQLRHLPVEKWVPCLFSIRYCIHHLFSKFFSKRARFFPSTLFVGLTCILLDVNTPWREYSLTYRQMQISHLSTENGKVSTRLHLVTAQWLSLRWYLSMPMNASALYNSCRWEMSMQISLPQAHLPSFVAVIVVTPSRTRTSREDAGVNL